MFSLHGGRVVGALVDARAGRMIGWILKPEESVVGASIRSNTDMSY